tara:strand:- start:57 stop:326 length:270 start_codon:yes stop_codon:yes gene_type:complete
MNSLPTPSVCRHNVQTIIPLTCRTLTKAMALHLGAGLPTLGHLSNLEDPSALYVARASPMPEPTTNALRSIRAKIEFGEAGVKKRTKKI